SGGTRDGDASRLQRLAQRLEHGRLKFRELVEKEHAVMGAADLPGLRNAAASPDESGRGDAVVRGDEGSRPVERVAARQLAEEAAHLRHLQGFGQVERWEDAGKAAGEHRLAGPGRTAEQE